MVKNPKSQRRRYDMLERAITINKVAALASISIGVGQVMGSHWKTLGFERDREDVRPGRDGTLVKSTSRAATSSILDLKDELDRLDWSGFARGYNGPAYRKNPTTPRWPDYAAALRLLREQCQRTPRRCCAWAPCGARVREVQQLPVAPVTLVTVDGDFGPSTRSRHRLPKASKITVDGVVGPRPMRALQRYKTSARTAPRQASGRTLAPDLFWHVRCR